MRKISTLCTAALLVGAAPLAADFSFLGFKGYLGADGGLTNGRIVNETTVNNVERMDTRQSVRHARHVNQNCLKIRGSKVSCNRPQHPDGRPA